MNVCAQFEERVIAEAAGDLEIREQPALQAHVRECDACCARLARERELFSSVDAGIAARAAGEPSADFTAKVMAQTTGEAERKLLAAIDAGLARAVAAEPSPAFAAAVRQRIAAEPVPPRAWFLPGWWMPAAGAVAAAVLLAIAFWPSESKLNVGNRAPAVPSNLQVGDNPGTPPHTGRSSIHGKQAPRESAPIFTAAASASLPSEPEVLIPDDERRVVTRFYRFVQEGRINPAQVLEANRIELAAKLGELQTPLLAMRSSEVKTMGLVDSVRSTSEDK